LKYCQDKGSNSDMPIQKWHPKKKARDLQLAARTGVVAFGQSSTWRCCACGTSRVFFGGVPKRCGLDLNHNLSFPDGHELVRSK
jgi:hypothetical protein